MALNTVYTVSVVTTNTTTGKCEFEYNNTLNFNSDEMYELSFKIPDGTNLTQIWRPLAAGGVTPVPFIENADFLFVVSDADGLVIDTPLVGQGSHQMQLLAGKPVILMISNLASTFVENLTGADITGKFLLLGN